MCPIGPFTLPFVQKKVVITHKTLREEIILALEGKFAYMGFETAVKDFPTKFINKRPPNVPYTFWHLIEHLRITQIDILDYIEKGGKYIWPKWPDDYWPKRTANTNRKGFDESVRLFRKDFAKLKRIAKDPKRDLLSTFRQDSKALLIHELTMVADHNAYHIGELGILRQVMKGW